jgi:pimeloyl-ACP methyl ester carboxylesterase
LRDDWGVIEERTETIGGVRVHWHEAPAELPILYLHGVPTAGWEWLSFLERTGGIALDLPGFGESEKPVAFDYTMDGYADFLEAFAEARGLDRHALVLHDWGTVGLVYAQRRPDRIERLVLMNNLPLFSDYRWHWIARIWRTPLLGELFNRTSSRWGYKQLSRQSNATRGPLPDSFIDRAWAGLDADTNRAILALYRSSPSSALGPAGARLGELRCPALVLWGAEDPYLHAGTFAPRYADALGGPVELEIAEGAGHWPWLDRPELVDRVAEFLRQPRDAA